MKPYSSLRIILLATALVATTPALACSAAGPNTHVGTVLSVDKVAGSFTILDAESGNPVTLTADVSLLEQAAASGRVTVRYEKDGATLRATELK